MSKSEKLKAAWKIRILTFVPPMKGKKMSAKSRNKMSESAQRRVSNRIGCKHTAATKKRISLATIQRTPRGPKHYNFKHGRFQRNINDRRTPKYKRWRLAVFTRDNFVCQKCGSKRGRNLRAHHKKRFSTHPRIRFVVSNGITLCHPCHELEHYGKPRPERKRKRGELLWK